MRGGTLAAGTLASVLALVLTAGCASTGGEGPGRATQRVSDPRYDTLDQDDLSEALVSADLLGGGFVDRVSFVDLTQIGPGCLEVFDSVHRVAFPRRELGVTIRSEDRTSALSVHQSVATFFTEREAAEALAAIRARTGTCDRVQTSDELPTYDLRLDHDRRRVSPEVAGQVNVIARGLLGLSGRALPMTVGMSAMRIGSNVVLTALFDPAGDVRAGLELVNRTAALRLAAVVDGEPVPSGTPLEVLGVPGGPTSEV